MWLTREPSPNQYWDNDDENITTGITTSIIARALERDQTPALANTRLREMTRSATVELMSVHSLLTTAVSAPSQSRRQLTLFVPAPWGARLDALRQTLDPIQASLIAAHVTLCREDEIAPIDASLLFRRVATWAHGPLHLTFGPPRRFSGHGALLPCEQGAGQFHTLRQWLLHNEGVRVHDAHLTMAHPRNTRAEGNTDVVLAECPRELQLQFATVSLIEQQGTAAWRTLRQSVLGAVG